MTVVEKTFNLTEGANHHFFSDLVGATILKLAREEKYYDIIYVITGPDRTPDGAREVFNKSSWGLLSFKVQASFGEKVYVLYKY